MIAGIVLAAGLARRMGRQKLLLSLEGKPVVRWAVERLLPHVEDLVVVTGHDDSTVRHALSGLAVRFAVNPRPEAGQASSIAVGVEALRPRTRAVLVALGDQPKTPDPVVPALLSAFARSGKPIVVPYCRAARAVLGFDRISRVIAETSSTGNVSLSVNPAASEIRSRFSNASRINQLIGGSVVRRARAEKCDGAWFIASDGAAVSTTLRGSPTCPCSHCQVRLRMPARDCTPCSCKCL